jgi:hypothetical protein
MTETYGKERPIPDLLLRAQAQVIFSQLQLGRLKDVYAKEKETARAAVEQRSKMVPEYEKRAERADNPHLAKLYRNATEAIKQNMEGGAKDVELLTKVSKDCNKLGHEIKIFNMALTNVIEMEKDGTMPPDKRGEQYLGLSRIALGIAKIIGKLPATEDDNTHITSVEYCKVASALEHVYVKEERAFPHPRAKAATT